MSYYCRQSEINNPIGGSKVGAYCGLKKTNCGYCGEEFAFTPGLHTYVRLGGKYKFCSYSCMRKFDKERPDRAQSNIDRYQRKVDYYEAQARLPVEQRDAAVRDVHQLALLLDRAQICLSNAIRKRAEVMG